MRSFRGRPRHFRRFQKVFRRFHKLSDELVEGCRVDLHAFHSVLWSFQKEFQKGFKIFFHKLLILNPIRSAFSGDCFKSFLGNSFGNFFGNFSRNSFENSLGNSFKNCSKNSFGNSNRNALTNF